MQGEDCLADDLDGDGIPNAIDQCKMDPEDKDGFQDDDGCPDLDNDQDGIPDAADKCPNEAEDKNGLKDDDGCPDEPERLAAIAEARRIEEARAREKAERDRQEQARLAAEQEGLRQQELEESRRRRANWRTAGYVTMGIGGGVLIGSGVFALLSRQVNSNIQGGSLASGQDIQKEADKGQTYNTVGYALAGASGGLVIIGGIMLLASPDPSPAPRLRYPLVSCRQL